MAEINVFDKTDLTDHTPEVTGGAVNNWISQINAGGTIYDIATHHAIKFVDGNGGVETVWNGLTDIEIVIPTIKDIVQTPIEFAGTVGANGVISWNDEHKDGPKTGYLVFVTVDCTFAGKACEAGDMAIYDGANWNIVSGENQVSIVGTMDNNNRATIAIGASKDVLTVEGKTLALTLDYTDLNKHVSVSKGGSATAAVKFGNMTVDSAYLKLSQGAGSSKTIGKAETIQKASKLKDGTVTLTGTDDIVTDVTFGTFNAGSLHEIVLNEDARTFAVTGGSLTKNTGATGDFVTSVTLDDVTFGTSTQGATGAFALVNGITPGSGQSFVTGINGKTEFTVEGCLQPTDGVNAKYVKGIEGSYVTGLTTGGAFSLGKGSDIVIGFGSETTEKGDVISSVEVSANNDTDVLASASVTNHVLSFAPAKVASGVTVKPKYKTLEKTTYSFTPASVSTTSFVNGGFTKASDVKYTFNTANETTYTTTSGYYKLTTPDLKVSYGGYTLENAGMVANVSANTFAVNVSGGVLPTLGASSVTKKANITGSVATDLDYTNVTINAVDSTAMSITLPGAYELVAGSAGDGIEVGKAGSLAAKSATVDLSNYVTDVTITESVKS